MQSILYRAFAADAFHSYSPAKLRNTGAATSSIASHITFPDPIFVAAYARTAVLTHSFAS